MLELEFELVKELTVCVLVFDAFHVVEVRNPTCRASHNALGRLFLLWGWSCLCECAVRLNVSVLIIIVVTMSLLGLLGVLGCFYTLCL